MTDLGRHRCQIRNSSAVIWGPYLVSAMARGRHSTCFAVKVGSTLRDGRGLANKCGAQPSPPDAQHRRAHLAPRAARSSHQLMPRPCQDFAKALKFPTAVFSHTRQPDYFSPGAYVVTSESGYFFLRERRCSTRSSCLLLKRINLRG